VTARQWTLCYWLFVPLLAADIVTAAFEHRRYALIA
jgi:hypothetical protein